MDPCRRHPRHQCQRLILPRSQPGPKPKKKPPAVAGGFFHWAVVSAAVLIPTGTAGPCARPRLPVERPGTVRSPALSGSSPGPAIDGPGRFWPWQGYGWIRLRTCARPLPGLNGAGSGPCLCCTEDGSDWSSPCLERQAAQNFCSRHCVPPAGPRRYLRAHLQRHRPDAQCFQRNAELGGPDCQALPDQRHGHQSPQHCHP